MVKIAKPDREPDLKLRTLDYSEETMFFWWEERLQYNTFSGKCYLFNPDNWTWLMSNDVWSPYSNFLADELIQDMRDSYLKWLMEKELLDGDT